MLARLYTRISDSLGADRVCVEVHASAGLPRIQMVGLPEMAVKESRERVRSAILQSGFRMPERRITINLTPADLPKAGTHYDLPIALGILLASNQLRMAHDSNANIYPSADTNAETATPDTAEPLEFYGELSLSGDILATTGLRTALIRSTGNTLIIPAENAPDAAVIGNKQFLLARNLREVVAHLRGAEPLPTAPYHPPNARRTPDMRAWQRILGQAYAKMAAVYAISGGHNLLMLGPPGCGKSMIAQSLPDLLPPLNEQAAYDVAAIESIGASGAKQDDAHTPTRDFYTPPFRAPHHSISNAALIGGGVPPKPGDISLAHHGVLFLDELPEFNRSVLEALREPLETRMVSISRARHKVVYPAKCQVVAAMNPCPYGSCPGPEQCQCTQARVAQYRSRISGPLLDRIDMHIELHAIDSSTLTQPKYEGAPSEDIQKLPEQIATARDRQYERQGCLNAHLADMARYWQPSTAQTALLENAVRTLNLSARAYYKILALSLTIADFHARTPEDADIAMAIGLRDMGGA